MRVEDAFAKAVGWMETEIVMKAFPDSKERYAVMFMLPLKMRKMYDPLIEQLSDVGLVKNGEVDAQALKDHALLTADKTGPVVLQIGSRNITLDKGDLERMFEFIAL